jgi:Ca-activated chloride channel family protein
MTLGRMTISRMSLGVTLLIRQNGNHQNPT